MSAVEQQATEQPPTAPRPDAWLDEQWTTDDQGQRRWPWPGRHDFTVRLEHALGGELILRSVHSDPVPVTSWRPLVDATLGQVLSLQRIARRLATELLGHLRAAGVEPAWGQTLCPPRPAEQPSQQPPAFVGDRETLLPGARAVLDAIFDACGGDYRWIDSAQVLGRALEIAARVKYLELQLAAAAAAVATPRRTPLPPERASVTVRFTIGKEHGYLIVGEHPAGVPQEIYCVIAKEGGTLRGLLDAWARLFSVALQFGMPLDELVRKFRGARFEPQGWTDVEGIGFATSIPDLVVRFLEKRYLQPETSEELSLVSDGAVR